MDATPDPAPAAGAGPRVAVVGSGPAGFYAAEALLRAGIGARVHLIERLPVPFGLVRHGVAPDHPRLKAPAQVFDRVARTPGLRFFGHVSVGRDVSLEALQRSHHAVILATGAPGSRPLEVPGAGLPGSHDASDFVHWVNGHPDFAHLQFDLSGPVAVVIGQGNVAVDVCRLLARPVDELRGTDMADHALEALARSRIEEIHLVGRRGPAQARFTTRELRELGALPGVSVTVAPGDLDLGAASREELQDRLNTVAQANLEVLRGFAAAAPPAAVRRRIHLHFHLSPREVLGPERVRGLRLARNRLEGPPFRQQALPTGETVHLPCQLLVASIGYRGAPVPGAPFDTATATIPNTAGRVTDADGQPVPGLYVAGWARRGPSGVIGTNRQCAVEVVEALLQDLPALPAPGLEAEAVLPGGVPGPVLDYAHWERIDAEERARGEAAGRPRVKLCQVEEMLRVGLGR